MSGTAGLVTGRIVYFVPGVDDADRINRRRTTGASIAAQMKNAIPPQEGQNADTIYGWPAGAQAHFGNPVAAGDILPAMVVGAFGGPNVNLKVQLDGTDVYWATSVPFGEGESVAGADPTAVVYPQYSWHWMFDKQSERYTPGGDAVREIVKGMLDEHQGKWHGEPLASQPTEEEIRSWMRGEVAQQIQMQTPERGDVLTATSRERVEKIVADAKEIQTRHGDSAAYVHVMGDLRRLLDTLPA